MTNHGRKYGERVSHPIPVWNGILEHLPKMGMSIWLYLWCLDRITYEEDGVGHVLGGSPVTVEKIAKDLGRSPRALRRDFGRLRSRYLHLRWTPFGYAIEVLNSRKFGIWKPLDSPARSGEARDESGEAQTENGRAKTKNGRSKEDAAVAAVDSAVDAADPAAPWKAIGTEELGTTRFRAKWEFLFAHRDGNLMSYAMERCILACQKSRIPVPKPFYDAKRKVEADEKEQRPSTHHGKADGLPYLDPMPPIPCAKKS